MNAFKNIFRVAVSNIITIICGVLVGFVIPKIMSVEDYGMYKTFTLYTSYVGLFSLGLIDGIVLRYGGKDYEELDKLRFRAYGKCYFYINGTFTIALIIIGSLLFNDNSLLIMLVAIDIVGLNFIGYYQQISQITQRFNEYSLRKIIQSIINIIIVLVLFVIGRSGIEIDYKMYCILTVLLNYAMMGWYVYTYRSITFGKSNNTRDCFGDIISLIKEGFPLLFANLCSTLIVSIDRQFVNIFFLRTDYAIYAFAYSMLSLVTVATSAISTVLYPMLRRMKDAEFKEKYDFFVSMISVLVFVLVAAYFPLGIIIENFLPKYSDSIHILKIIIPGIAVSSCITVIMHNYYKTLGESTSYFKKSVIILSLSAMLNYLAIRLFGTMESVSVASVVTIFVWYLLCDFGLKRHCRSNLIKNVLYITIIFALFYGCSSFLPYYFGFLVYVVLFAFLSFAFYFNYIKVFIRGIKK